MYVGNAQLFLFVNIFCCLKTGINLLSDDIKNVSSSTYSKKLKLWDFIYFLSSTFIYEPILIFKKSLKTQIFHKMKYDRHRKGHIRSS